MNTLMTLSFSVFCKFQTCMSPRRHKSAACRCCVRLPPNAYECGQVWQCTRGRVLGRSPRRRCRHSRIPSRTARLAHAHRDAGRFCRGKSDTPSAPPRRVGICPRVPARSTRLPGRGLHCSRDSGSKQTTSSEWGSLVTGLSPLLETNLRAEPSEKLYATDASPDGAGGCAASITQEDWLALYDLAEKKGEHVRLDWKGE